MLKVINPRIRMASGDELKGGYWSSTEYEDNAWWIDVFPHYGIEPKTRPIKSVPYSPSEAGQPETKSAF